MSNLDNNSDVLSVFENLFEELGFGSNKEPTHSEIYKNMLNEFGLDLKSQPINPSTQALINTMMNFCKQPQGVYGLAALCIGAEAIVPSMYADIVKEGLKKTSRIW